MEDEQAPEIIHTLDMEGALGQGALKLHIKDAR